MKVGLQLYTVREPFGKDPKGTLNKISETGYKYLEVFTHNSQQDCGCFGLKASELKAMADAAGVVVISAHIGAADDWALIKNKSQMDRIIDYNAELGCETLVLSAEYFQSFSHVMENCSVFNDLGRRCKEAGLGFLYHNHFWDFQEIDGKAIMDILVENTDSEYVGVQIDAYWTYRGLIDPIKVVHKYKDRVKCLHQKDFPIEQVENLNIWKRLDESRFVTPEDVAGAIRPEEFIEIGEGIMKIQELIHAGNEYNVPYVLLEQDFSKHEPFESIKISMNNYKKMNGIEFD